MMMPKEAKDALRSLEHLDAELTKLRKEMAEFKLLLAQQNDILCEMKDLLKKEDEE